MIDELALKGWLGTLALAGKVGKWAFDKLVEWGREPPTEAARELSGLPADASVEQIVEAVRRADAALHGNASHGGVVTNTNVSSGAVSVSNAIGSTVSVAPPSTQVTVVTGDAAQKKRASRRP